MRRWLAWYSAAAVGTVAALLLVIWAVGGFEDMGLTEDGMIALILAVSFTVLLSFGLMGLVFYSGRSGHDDTVMDGDKSPEGKQHRPRRHRASDDKKN